MVGLKRRELLATAAAMAALPPPARAQAPAALDRILGDAAASGAVPGVVALATGPRGLLYEGAFGRRSLPDGPAMTPDSVFWIASMTKAVTSTAAMQLVEEGRLDLDRPMGELLPELAAPQVLDGFDPSGAPRLRPARRPITLRHLLTHTAGFSYDLWNPDIGRYMAVAKVPAIITCENAALTTPLVFDPGERWEYGINIDWVGKAVERSSGRDLETYFKERIFAPLRMADTGFVLGPSQRERLVRVHARGGNGVLQPIELEIPQQPEFFMGGGGLYSTGPDYLRFVGSFLHEGSLDGARILKPETVALMAANQIGELNVRRLVTAMPSSSNDAEFFPGMVKKWGLGFMITTEAAPTGRVAGSLAWAGLANTYFWIDPTRRVGGVVLTQILPFADAPVLDLLAAVERGAYEAAGRA